MSPASPAASGAGDLPLTDAARRLLAEARAESERLRHEYVGTEHLVLALARQPDDASALGRLGVDGAGVRATIAARVVPGHATPAPGAARPYTSRTQQVFTLAAESARALGHAQVGVEHLLVGMLRERVNFGAQVLEHHGLTPERALEDAGRAAGGPP